MDTNIPVGFLAEWQYTSQQIMLPPQTSIFLYTDGLTEARNAEKEMFGKQRMNDVIRKAIEEGKTAPEQTIRMMAEAKNRFVNGNEQSDDLTMLAIRYNKTSN